MKSMLISAYLGKLRGFNKETYALLRYEEVYI
jgi:hypothetical protein